MEQNSDMAQLLRLAQSPAGQQLFALLQRQGGNQLQEVIAKASAGDYTQAKQTLSALLDTPEAKKLLKQMGGEL